MLEWWQIGLMVIGALCLVGGAALVVWVVVLQWRLESLRDADRRCGANERRKTRRPTGTPRPTLTRGQAMKRWLLALALLAVPAGVQAQCSGTTMGYGVKVNYDTATWDMSSGSIWVGGDMCRESGTMGGMEIKWRWNGVHRDGCAPTPNYGTSGSCEGWESFYCPESYTGWVNVYADISSPSLNGYTLLVRTAEQITCDSGSGQGGMW